MIDRSPRLPPELEILLLCARPAPQAEDVERARALVSTGLDWGRMVEKARANGITPLLSRGLQGVGAQLLPPAVRDHLQAQTLSNAQRSLYLARELLTLLDLFTAHDIPAIPYKGPLLAQTVYGSLALRPFEDLDILIHKADALKARDLLADNGCRIVGPQIPLPLRQEQAHLQAKYNFKLERQSGAVVVELHWGVTPQYYSFPPDPEWLWQQLEQIELAGKPVSTFSPEDYLLILCAHGANHCWLYRLSWICDIAELLHRNPGLQWDYLIEQARGFGALRMLLLGLLLAQDLLGSPLPEAIWLYVAGDRRVRAMADQTIDHYAGRDGGEPGSFYIPLFQVNARERLRDKGRYCLYMSSPSVKDWSSWQLPIPLAFFYYLLRPVRLIIEHGLKPLRQRL